MAISRIGTQSKNNFRLAGRWKHCAAITDTRFPDYIPQSIPGTDINWLKAQQVCCIQLIGQLNPTEQDEEI